MAEGIDPSLKKKLDKAGTQENTFQAIAEELLHTNSHKWSDSHQRHIQECFEPDVYNWMCSRSLKELSPVEVLTVLKKLLIGAR